MHLQRLVERHARAVELAELLLDQTEIDLHHGTGRSIAETGQRVDRTKQGISSPFEISRHQIDRAEGAQDNRRCARLSVLVEQTKRGFEAIASVTEPALESLRSSHVDERARGQDRIARFARRP